MSVEPNDTIFEARDSDVSSNVTRSAILKGEIAPDDDIDLYKFQANAGSEIILDIDARELDPDNNLDSILRLFDADGNELAQSDDSAAPGETSTLDSYISFKIDNSGDYYVGVSSFSNTEYDPLRDESSDRGGSTGDYELEISFADVASDGVDPDNTIAEAIATGLDEAGETATFSDSIENNSDIDIYQFQLDSGEAIVVNRSLDSAGIEYRLFDKSGNSVEGEVITTNAVSSKVPNGSRFRGDSALTFIPETSGNYYLGLSTFDNETYNPINGSGAQSGFGSGAYELEFEIIEIGPDTDPDNTIAEAIATEIDGTGGTIVSNTIDSGDDVDLYQVSLIAGDTITLDLDAAENDSTLDSGLRLLDADGNELAQSDDNFDSPNEDLNFDSYLTFEVETTGNYYIGVSSFVNLEYDVVKGTTNVPQFNRERGGDYQLEISVAESAPDNDRDNPPNPDRNVDQDSDNTIAEANNTDIATEGEDFVLVADSIDSDNDVDVFEFQLDAGDVVTFNLNGEQFASELDSVLRIFDADGNELASNDDGSAPGEISTRDSYLEFTTQTTGSYYLGVSGFANFDYDVVNGNPSGGNFSVGDYEIVINSFSNIAGTDSSEIIFGNSDNTFVDGLDGSDVITGGGNNDYFLGGDGNDVLSGNNGDDTLIGGRGFDALSGGAGADVLQGDGDSNILFGGTGADIFAIAENENAHNLISDFEDGTDKIRLDSGSSFDDLTIENVADGSGVVISSSFGNGITTVHKINASSLSSDDFLAG